MKLINRIKTAALVELEIRGRYTRPTPRPVHVKPVITLADGSHMIITKY